MDLNKRFCELAGIKGNPCDEVDKRAGFSGEWLPDFSNPIAVIRVMKKIRDGEFITRFIISHTKKEIFDAFLTPNAMRDEAISFMEAL